MYQNYGDVDFFENGILVEQGDSETEFKILYCQPYFENERFLFAECTVDIEDGWINRWEVMQYIGMQEENFHPVEYAIGCLTYYGPENFGAYTPAYVWTQMQKEEICEILKSRGISIENLAFCGR